MVGIFLGEGRLKFYWLVLKDKLAARRTFKVKKNEILRKQFLVLFGSKYFISKISYKQIQGDFKMHIGVSGKKLIML